MYSTHILVICYKLSSLTVKIRKPEKWKFGRIDSWSHFPPKNDVYYKHCHKMPFKPRRTLFTRREWNSNSGVNPTKLFFFVNEEFFRFSLLSLAVVQYTHFFICNKLSSLTGKIGKPEKWKFGKIDSWAKIISFHQKVTNI